MERLNEVKYDLMRISYDAATGTWGKRETVLSAAESGMSAAQPKESPDGRWLAGGDAIGDDKAQSAGDAVAGDTPSNAACGARRPRCRSQLAQHQAHGEAGAVLHPPRHPPPGPAEHREQQRHGPYRAKPRQDADRRSDEGAQEGVQHVYWAQRNGKTAAEI